MKPAGGRPDGQRLRQVSRSGGRPRRRRSPVSGLEGGHFRQIQRGLRDGGGGGAEAGDGVGVNSDEGAAFSVLYT